MDKIYVEPKSGAPFYATMINKCGNICFMQDSNGNASVIRESDANIRPLQEGEAFPEPVYPTYELPRTFEPTPPVIPETPSWTKGQEIKSGEERWLVTDVFPDKDELEITPLELSPHMGTYIEKGNKYRLVKHSSFGFAEGEGLWEIPSEAMNRSSSQVLLYLWEDGPSIEIDF
jgi:hypothetical protein